MNELERLWHHARSGVAAELLDTFTSTGNNKVVMFERRRRGKTDLLLYDVTPAAEKAGYQVIYVNIWDNSADPAGRLLNEYLAALRPRSLADRLSDWGKSPVERIKLSGELYGAKGEVEIGLNGKGTDRAASTTLEALKEAAERLAKRRRKILLMVDEVQALAEGGSNLSLVRALRTQLDTHKGHIFAIFTGSSREGLLRLFAAKNAPFFQSSESFTLPEMDRGFVQHLLGVFKTITQLEVRESAAMRVFESVRKSPYHFRKIIGLAVSLRDPDIEKMLTVYRTRLPEQEGYVVSWQGLSRHEQALLLAVATGNSSIYSKAAADAMGTLLSQLPKSSGVQRAAKGLMAKRLLTKANPSPLISDRTNYVLEDEEMGEWLRGDGLAIAGRSKSR